MLAGWLLLFIVLQILYCAVSLQYYVLELAIIGDRGKLEHAGEFLEQRFF